MSILRRVAGGIVIDAFKLERDFRARVRHVVRRMAAWRSMAVIVRYGRHHSGTTHEH